MWLAFNYFKSPSRPHTSGKRPTPIPSLRSSIRSLPISMREIDGHKVPSTYTKNFLGVLYVGVTPQGQAHYWKEGPYEVIAKSWADSGSTLSWGVTLHFITAQLGGGFWEPLLRSVLLFLLYFSFLFPFSFWFWGVFFTASHPSIHPSIPFPFFVTYCRFTHTPKSQATKWDKDGTCKLQCALESNRPSSVIGRFWCGSTASNAASLAVVLLCLSPVADASCWVKLSANALGHGCDLKRIRARHHSSLPSTHLLSRLSSALWNSPTQKLFILCILIYKQIF